MLIVCVHYPLDPQMSKKCIARAEHEFEHVSQLTIPFTASSRTFMMAVERMYVLDNITGTEMLELKRQFEKDPDEPLTKRFDNFAEAGWPSELSTPPA